jgi:hypothetical protein
VVVEEDLLSVVVELQGTFHEPAAGLLQRPLATG